MDLVKVLDLPQTLMSDQLATVAALSHGLQRQLQCSALPRSCRCRADIPLRVQEFSSFLAVKTQHRMIVDRSPMGELLRLNFNVR